MEFHRNEKLQRNDVATTTATTAANQTQNPLPESQLGQKKKQSIPSSAKRKRKTEHQQTEHRFFSFVLLFSTIFAGKFQPYRSIGNKIVYVSDSGRYVSGIGRYGREIHSRRYTAAGNAITMERAVKKLLFESRIQSLSCEKASRPCIRIPFFQLSSLAVIENSSSQIASKHRDSMKVYAMRRRRSNIETDTYVLMEPGKNEEFVNKDELRDRLKGWLENWPGKSLPPDLARFEDINDAVSYLVKSVCELEIDGDVGSIQWFEVRLE